MCDQRAAACAEVQAVQRDGIIPQHHIAEAEIQRGGFNMAGPGTNLLAVQLHRIAQAILANQDSGIGQGQGDGVALRLGRQLEMRPILERVIVLSVKIALHSGNGFAPVDLGKQARSVYVKLIPLGLGKA